MRIVIGVDGSPLSELVVQSAAAMLKESEGEAILTRVLLPEDFAATYADVPQSRAPAPLPGTAFAPTDVRPRVAEGRDQAIERAHNDAQEDLQRTGARCLAGVPFRIVVTSGDDAARGLINVASTEGANFIAVGAHRSGGLRRAVLGRVGEAVVRESPVPVLVVRPGMHG
jgi:nucleotide-binding universal stress UspA family protein